MTLKTKNYITRGFNTATLLFLGATIISFNVDLGLGTIFFYLLAQPILEVILNKIYERTNKPTTDNS